MNPWTIRPRSVATALAMLAALTFSSCGQDFDPQSKINSVRILAAQLDKPYAKPGDKVTVRLLAFDGRPDTSRPMNIYWLPVLCTNPRDDLYYACFRDMLAQLAQQGPRGSGGASLIQPGTDLSPFLPQGDQFAVDIPSDIIDRHPPVKGSRRPYGLGIVFNMACAGHVELLPIDPNNIRPQIVPVACFDDAHNRLTPNEYVFGFTRIYVYRDLENTNPQLEGVLVDGKLINETEGFHADKCTNAKEEDCRKIKIETNVPQTSWELNPIDTDGDGNPLHEQIWATYYASAGQFTDEATLEYDVRVGSITNSKAEYRVPKTAGEGLMWVVVHDSRGGAEWRSFPIHIHEPP